MTSPNAVQADVTQPTGLVPPPTGGGTPAPVGIVAPPTDNTVPATTLQGQVEKAVDPFKYTGAIYGNGMEQEWNNYKAAVSASDPNTNDATELEQFRNMDTGSPEYQRNQQYIDASNNVYAHQGLAGWAQKSLMGGTAAVVPGLQFQAEGGVATGAVGAGVGAAAGLAGGPLSEVTVPGGAAAGWSWGWKAGSFETAAISGFGQAYRQARLAGASRDSAYITAMGVGSIVGILNTAELKLLGGAAGDEASRMARTALFEKTIAQKLRGVMLRMGATQAKLTALGGVTATAQQAGAVAAHLIDHQGEAAKKTAQDSFSVILHSVLDSIGPNFVLAAGAHAAGKVVGEGAKKAKITMSPENHTLHYDGVPVHEVLRHAYNIMAGIHDERSGVVYDSQGNPSLQTGVAVTANPKETAAPISVKEAVHRAAEASAGLEDIPEYSKAGDTGLPKADAGADITPLAGSPEQVDKTPKTPREVEMRLNQLKGERAALERETARLQREIQARAKDGRPAAKVVKAQQKIVDVLDANRYEQAVLESGILDAEDIGNRTGSIKLKKLTAVIRQLHDFAHGELLRGRQEGADAVHAQLEKIKNTLIAAIDASGVSKETKNALKAKLLETTTTPRDLTRVLHGHTSRNMKREFYGEPHPETGKYKYKNVPTGETIHHEGLLDYLTKETERQAQLEAHARIEKIADTAKLLKGQRGGSVLKGKFTAGIQEQLDAYKNFMADPTAREVAMRNPDEDPVIQDIAAQLDGFEEFDAAQLNGVADAMKELVDTGRQAARERRIDRKLRREKLEAQALKSIDAKAKHTHAQAVGKLETVKRWAHQQLLNDLGFRELMTMLSEHDSKHWLAENLDPMHSRRTELRNTKIVFSHIVNTLQAALTQVSDKKLSDKMNADSHDTLKVTFENQDGQSETRSYTKAQLLNWAALLESAKRGNLQARLAFENTGFTFKAQAGEKSMETMLDRGLDDSEHALVQAAVDYMSSDAKYESDNAVQRERTGVNLRREPGYWPLSRDDVGSPDKDIDRENVRLLNASVTASAMRPRVNTSLPLRPENFYDVIFRNASEVEHQRAYQDFVDDTNAVLGSGRVRGTLRNKYGANVLKTVDYYRNRVITGHSIAYEDGAGWRAFGQARAIGALGLKGTIVVKHLASTHLYWVGYGPMEVMRGLAELARHPAQTIKTLYEDPILAARWSNYAEEVHNLSRSKLYKELQHADTLKNALLIVGRASDAVKTVIGGGVQYHMELARNGGDHQAAMDAVVHRTEEFQSSSGSDRVSLSRGSSILGRVFGQFQGNENAMFQMEALTVHEFKMDVVKNGLTKKNWSRFLIRMAAMRAAAVVAQAGISGISYLIPPKAGGTQASWDDFSNKMERALVMGNLNGFFVAGDVANQVVSVLQTNVVGAHNLINTPEVTIAGVKIPAIQLRIGAGKVISAQAIPFEKPVDDLAAFTHALNGAINVTPLTEHDIETGFNPRQAAMDRLLGRTSDLAENAGLPGQMYNGYEGTQEALKHDDPAGAAQALAGAPESTIKERYPKLITSFAQLGKPEKPTLLQGLSNTFSALQEDMSRRLSPAHQEDPDTSNAQAVDAKNQQDMQKALDAKYNGPAEPGAPADGQ